MDISSITMNLAIAVAVYIVIEIIKKIAGNNFSKLSYFVPLIAVAVGIAFGVVCYAVLPAYITADSYLTAAIVGGFSGGAAVCGNQTIKQTAKRLMEKWGVTTSESSTAPATTVTNTDTSSTVSEAETNTTGSATTGTNCSAGESIGNKFANDQINV